MFAILVVFEPPLDDESKVTSVFTGIAETNALFAVPVGLVALIAFAANL